MLTIRENYVVISRKKLVIMRELTSNYVEYTHISFKITRSAPNFTKIRTNFLSSRTYEFRKKILTTISQSDSQVAKKIRNLFYVRFFVSTENT